jgi:hypothetical protein
MCIDVIEGERRYKMLCLEEIGRTYALMSITLDNRESARVLGILHDKPVPHISFCFLSLSSILGNRCATHQPRHSLSFV